MQKQKGMTSVCHNDWEEEKYPCFADISDVVCLVEESAFALSFKLTELKSKHTDKTVIKIN